MDRDLALSVAFLTATLGSCPSVFAEAVCSGAVARIGEGCARLPVAAELARNLPRLTLSLPIEWVPPSSTRAVLESGPFENDRSHDLLFRPHPRSIITNAVYTITYAS